MMCRFFNPIWRFCVTSVPMSSVCTARGSELLETIASRHECVAVLIGGVQSHSRTSGRVGDMFAIVFAVPTGVQGFGSAESAGNIVQKSDGRSGRPGEASAYRIFTIALAEATPLLCTCM